MVNNVYLVTRFFSFFWVDCFSLTATSCLFDLFVPSEWFSWFALWLRRTALEFNHLRRSTIWAVFSTLKFANQKVIERAPGRISATHRAFRPLSGVMVAISNNRTPWHAFSCSSRVTSTIAPPQSLHKSPRPVAHPWPNGQLFEFAYFCTSIRWHS